MITLLNYEMNERGNYVCHFSVGSIEMERKDAEREFQKISGVDFAVSPETMSISLNLGVPDYGSTITMCYKDGITVFYKANEYTSYVVDGNSILDANEVDIRWKTIFQNDWNIFPVTESGEKYFAMKGCPAPGGAGVIEVTENGYYGWPMDKDPSEWTEDEWLMGRINGVNVNVSSEPPAPAVVKTVVGTPTQVQVNEETSETYYCIEYDELKELMDSSDELVFKLSDSQYTRPLMGFATIGSMTHFEIIDLLNSTYNTADRTVGTKSICVIKNGSLRLTDTERNYIHNNINSKIPYNIYNTIT